MHPMSDSPRSPIDLPRVVQLAAQLHADESQSPDARIARDRRIAREHELPTARAARLAAWLDHASDDASRTIARRTRTATTLAALTLIVLGLALGASAAFAVFAYDGSHPINITAVVGIFVFAQLLTVILTVIAMIPQRIPGFAAVQRMLMAVSPGRVGSLFARLIPDKRRQQLEPVLGRIVGQQAVYSRLGRWAVLALGQQFGVAFNLAALAIAVAMVATTDLAFGWSTTLDIEPAVAHRIFAALAAPWAWAWPAASPDLQLVEATRYFRAVGTPIAADPTLRGQWWPFAVMCLLTYGLLPRLVLLLIARARRAAAARWTFTNTAGVSVVLARLSEPPQAPPGHRLPNAPAMQAASRTAHNARIVAWSDPPPVDSLTVDVHADGSHADPAAVVDRLADDQPILIITRAWEPPVAELFDFLAALRERTRQAQPIHLLPVGFDERNAATAPTDAQLDLWRRRTAAARDPWITVVTLPEVTS